MRAAEWGLHRRADLACSAATAAGVAGRFRAWESDGLLAVLATDPALRFRSTVSGVTSETLATAIGLATAPVWHGVRPRIVTPSDMDGQDLLSTNGFTRGNDGVLAVRRLDDDLVRPTGTVLADPDVDLFTTVLLAGYEADGTVAALIDAEHRHPAVRRFLLLADDVPVAAAAMTVHGEVAVLGGVATLRVHRGRGGQSALLRHRLHTAADAGCTLAVATVVPDSTSAANLRAAGFTVHRRRTWVQPARSSTATDRSARLPR